MTSRSGPGPFVYRGSGKVQAADADVSQKKCIPYACNIQHCLQKFNHQEEKCETVINAWKDCCKRARNAAVVKAAGEM